MPATLENVLEVTLPPFVPKEDARMMLAIKLFEAGRLSADQAATVANLSKRAFLDLLGKQGTPIVNHAASELANDLAW
ncbi:UPF0175 family protein [Opitutaceae bacterium TAV4]|nr:UPF0175 family protein [Opitutaceae bacterium TAV4]RRK01755.1 UPF0175 family protein [Opitutaceae bacterium TAV3]